jgi:TetR/AcrR family transcriptional repressor of nem operon
MDRSIARRRQQIAELAPEERLAHLVDTYLSPQHRDNPGHGCAMPALGAEIARESPKTRRAFAAKLDDLIEMTAEQYSGDPAAARKQAIAALATMMGTILMSRIAGSGEVSDEFLKVGRDTVLERAAAPPAAKRAAAKKASKKG